MTYIYKCQAWTGLLYSEIRTRTRRIFTHIHHLYFWMPDLHTYIYTQIWHRLIHMYDICLHTYMTYIFDVCVNIFHVFLNARFTHTYVIYVRKYVSHTFETHIYDMSCMCVNICHMCVWIWHSKIHEIHLHTYMTGRIFTHIWHRYILIYYLYFGMPDLHTYIYTHVDTDLHTYDVYLHTYMTYTFECQIYTHMP